MDDVGLSAMSPADRERLLRDWWLRLRAISEEMADQAEMFAWLLRAAEQETHRAMEREGMKMRPYA